VTRFTRDPLREWADNLVSAHATFEKKHAAMKECLDQVLAHLRTEPHTPLPEALRPLLGAHDPDWYYTRQWAEMRRHQDAAIEALRRRIAEEGDEHVHAWQTVPEEAAGYRCETCGKTGYRATNGPFCGQVLEHSSRRVARAAHAPKFAAVGPGHHRHGKRGPGGW